MDIVFSILGFICGFFLWSNIWGSLFASIPVRRNLVKMGILKSMNWVTIAAPILIAALVLVLAYMYLPSFFYPSLIGGFLMLLNIKNLKQEELAKYIPDIAAAEANEIHKKRKKK